MNIYDDERMNPAISLYRFWLGVLETVFGEVTHDSRQTLFTYFGPFRNWGIMACAFDHKMRPVLAVGRPGDPLLQIDADGRFAFRQRLFGTHQRNAIVWHTFLGYGWARSRYQWFVDPSRTSYGRPHRMLEDWRSPMHYVGEHVIWGWGQAWMVLKRVDGEWRLAPARNQQWPRQSDPWGWRNPRERRSRAASLAAGHRRRWAHYDAIRERRYRIAEDQERARANLPQRRRGARLLVDGRAVAGEEASRQLIALLDVSSPAQTKPLQPRPKEAQNGDNNLAATRSN